VSPFSRWCSNIETVILVYNSLNNTTFRFIQYTKIILKRGYCINVGRVSAVGIATRYGLDSPWFESQ